MKKETPKSQPVKTHTHTIQQKVNKNELKLKGKYF